MKNSRYRLSGRTETARGLEGSLQSIVQGQSIPSGKSHSFASLKLMLGREPQLRAACTFSLLSNSGTVQQIDESSTGEITLGQPRSLMSVVPPACGLHLLREVATNEEEGRVFSIDSFVLHKRHLREVRVRARRLPVSAAQPAEVGGAPLEAVLCTETTDHAESSEVARAWPVLQQYERHALGLLDCQGHLMWVNSHFENLYSLATQQTLGKKLTDLVKSSTPVGDTATTSGPQEKTWLTTLASGNTLVDKRTVIDLPPFLGSNGNRLRLLISQRISQAETRTAGNRPDSPYGQPASDHWAHAAATLAAIDLPSGTANLHGLLQELSLRMQARITHSWWLGVIVFPRVMHPLPSSHFLPGINQAAFEAGQLLSSFCPPSAAVARVAPCTFAVVVDQFDMDCSRLQEALLDAVAGIPTRGVRDALSNPLVGTATAAGQGCPEELLKTAWNRAASTSSDEGIEHPAAAGYSRA